MKFTDGCEPMPALMNGQPRFLARVSESPYPRESRLILANRACRTERPAGREERPALLPPDLPLLAAAGRHVADDGGRGPLPGGHHRAAAGCRPEPGGVRRCVRLRHHHRVAGHHADERLDRAGRGRGELPRPAPVRLRPGGADDGGAARRAAPSGLPGHRRPAAASGRRRPSDPRRPRHPAAVAGSHRLPPLSPGTAHPPPPDTPRAPAAARHAASPTARRCVWPPCR